MRTLKKATAFILASLMLCGCAKTAGNTPNNTLKSEDESMIESISANTRIKIDFNDGWLFKKLTEKDGLSALAIEETGFDDGSWDSVSLPHTWNAVDGCDGWSGIDEGGEHYYRGLGGYRKAFTLSEDEYSGKEIFIEFEGANTVAEVFVNGASAGTHEGGYSAFRFDITDLVKPGKENVVAVKVNNAPTDYIAPITNQGDFTKMGGIYRGVSLIAVDKLHIDLMDYGSSGVYVTPKNITSDGADIDLLVKLANDSSSDGSVTVKAEIIDEDGKTCAEAESVCDIKSESTARAEISLGIENPILWNGVKNPYLYSAKITVMNGDNIVDEYVHPFGIRTYNIDPENGFFLNGEYLDLHGVNYHQDSFENGWAMTDEQRERDYNMMLDMGCNTVRMAHYQHDGYEYDLCDRLGITVWSEIGIVNRMTADESDPPKVSDDFVKNAKRQLTELIRQNYNHPSVIVWGITNELYQMSDEIFDIYTELSGLAKSEDSTRLTTYADSQFWGRFLELPTDVVGYNRYFGWYKEAGSVEKFGEWLDKYHGNEKRPVCVSEYGGGGAISQHKDNIDWIADIDPWGERHYENYQSAMHESIWAQFSQRPYLWGKYVWCMFDFASDGRQEGDTKGQNDKGLATRERVPKDAYYFYKSVWNEEPMLHITEKRFETRPSEIPQVKAYSNAESVELFVNGESKGRVERSSLDSAYSTVFTWDNITLDIGRENEIKAVAGFADGTTVEDSAVWIGKYVEPEMESVNVALGKPIVYVSSEENGNPASGVNDGDASDSARWCAASADSYPASVIIDLENNYNISKIKVVTHKPGSRAYQFTVSISDVMDGEYRVISDHSGNSDKNGYFTDILSEPAAGRYLKIEVTGCSDSSAFPCIWELEAYEYGSASTS